MDDTAKRALRLAVLLGGSGVLHLVKPEPYERIMPPMLGNPRPWVTGSGLVEIGCAALLLVPGTRRLGGLASAALFVGVFPANLYSVKATAHRKWLCAGAIARLPLQLPMITAALAVGRDG